MHNAYKKNNNTQFLKFQSGSRSKIYTETGGKNFTNLKENIQLFQLEWSSAFYALQLYLLTKKR